MKNFQRSILFGILAAVFWTAAGPAVFGAEGNQDPSRDKRQPATADFTPPKLWERVEISLFGGLGIPITKLTTLHYTEAKTAAGLTASAFNRIGCSAKPDIFAGAGVTFFLPSGVGLQAGFGYLKSGLKIENEFRYSAPGSDRVSSTAIETGRGEQTSVPLFFCLFNKFDVRIGSQTLRAYLTAGPALFLNSVLADVRGGAVMAREDAADAFWVPVAVADTTWVAFGATAGLGLDVPLAKSLALTFEGRYFYCRKKSFPWIWERGAYDGIFGQVSGIDFDDASASRYDRDTTRLTIDPSLIQIACGLKLIF